MDHEYPPPLLRNLITLFSLMGTFMVQLDTTIANVAMPHMQASTSASREQITWVLTSYIIMPAICMPLTGWLAGKIGRKRLVLIALTGFTVSSVLCGLAANFEQLVRPDNPVMGCDHTISIPTWRATLPGWITKSDGRR